ncbi:hypothetical protein YC2023_107138 [Brassica napus]
MSEIEMEIRGKNIRFCSFTLPYKLKVYWPKRQTYGSTIIHAGAGKRQIQLVASCGLIMDAIDNQWKTARCSHVDIAETLILAS